MTISGLGSRYSTQSLTGTQSTSSIASLLETDDTDSTSSTSSTADLSKPGQLLAKLKQLQESDPAKFKEVVSSIAKKLSDAATEAGADTEDGQFLSRLASDFQKAADTGDLSSLQPPPPPSSDAVAAYQSFSGGSTGMNKAMKGGGAPPPPPPGGGGGPSDSVKSLLDQIDDDVTDALSGDTTA